MNTKPVVIVFLILFAAWLILNQSLDIQYIATGLVFSLVISLIFCRKCSVVKEIKLTPKAIIYSIAFMGVFLYELIRANIGMAMIVLSPSLPINPGIVKADTTLKSKMARLVLGNVITLTPGTFTVDIINDTLYIHCVNMHDEDPEVLGQKIIGKFQKYLEVIYG